MTVVPSDDTARIRALTDHTSTLLVEAAAGTGKTALLAGRITMLLAEGCAPGQIAAITFMEAAASDLSERVHRYVAELLASDTPRPLRAALPSGLTPLQKERLHAASAALHELTASTIHGFCQSILCTYAIEADIDPGARVVDATHADIVFSTVFDRWFRRRLSVPIESTDPIAILAREDPKHVLTTVRQLAQFRRRYRTARPIAADLSGRPDVDLVEAVREFHRWSQDVPSVKEMQELLAGCETLAEHYKDSFNSTPDFARLWRLAHPPRVKVMRSDDSFELKLPRMKGAWQRATGDNDAGARHNEEAMQRFGRVDVAYRTLLGKVATALISALSKDVDDVLDDYAQFKRAAALLDFDDLLYRTRDLVVKHDEVRLALGRRYPRILVDEFQDTDPLQAEILFRIGATVAPARWDEASLRSGSLYLVGDPKQAIFGFRGADIESYDRAKRAIGPESHIHVTANFRSRPAILSHVNRCFEQPLRAPGQPGYVEMTWTREPAQGGPPSVTKLTIEVPEHLEGARANDVRDAEAKAVADVCALLVGNVNVDDQGKRRPLKLSDIALLTPANTQLWRYEQALDDRGLPYASLAGKNLLDRQEVRDTLALARVLADADDTLAFGAFMRGPLVGLSEQELLDITGQLPPVPERPNDIPRFCLRTDPAHVAHLVAQETLTALRELWGASFSTTPQLILSEAIERLSIRSILSIREVDRSNRALANIDAFLELARGYDVRGLKQFVADLMRDWIEEVPHDEGRVDVFGAIQIVTMHSSKGLEWPVVIPINTVTWRRKRDQFVYRSSDETMHWVLKDVVPPDLHAVMQAQDEKEARERERLYYVAFTRAMDLLILPKLPTSDERAWTSTISDPHRDIPELDLSEYTLKPFPKTAPEKNEQAPQVFSQEQAAVRACSRQISWVRPSQDDLDRVPVSDLLAAQDEDPLEVTIVAGAGRIRGLLLHKLMEEVLTGETAADRPTLVARAAMLAEHLSQGRQPRDVPVADELAATIERTLSIPEIAALRTGLIPEIGVYGTLSQDEGVFVSGRIDAVYLENTEPRIAVDWKSDVGPSGKDIEIHSAQLRAYMRASGIPRGVLVYMSTSRLFWLDERAQGPGAPRQFDPVP